MSSKVKNQVDARYTTGPSLTAKLRNIFPKSKPSEFEIQMSNDVFTFTTPRHLSATPPKGYVEGAGALGRVAMKYFVGADDAWAQLASLKVFSPSGRMNSLDCIDVIAGANGKTEKNQMTFENARSLKEYLKEAPMISRTRFISIFQKNSWASLNICQSMLRIITDTHDVMPEFLNVVRCFQDKTSNVEQAFGGASWKRCTTESKEIAFVLKYPESNGRTDGADPWSIRQTGIYQNFNPTTNSSLWILLNPRQGNSADDRIRHLLNAQERVPSLHCQPPLVGLVVLSTFFTNWRTYMAFYEEEELRMSRIVISAFIDEKLQFSHSTLSGLRRIESRVLLLRPIFQSLTNNIKVLETFNDALRAGGSISEENHNDTQEVLQNYVAMVAAYNSNVTFLLDKIQGTAQLLAETLNLKHQQTAECISENTLALSDAATKDSATIRIITVVTLIYLPTSFIATLFGMQFFATDAAGHLTVASSQLWVFFAFAAPLTAATFGYWKWKDRKLRLKACLDKA